MIVDNPRRPQQAGKEQRSVWEKVIPSHAGRIAAFVLALFVLIVGLQIASGAYNSEFGGYPDEPAHYITGLMVRDYIAGLNFTSPLKFAEDYYDHYPKVAFGHWPPLLYILQALWMLVFSPARASVLLELACFTLVLALSVGAFVKRHFGNGAAVLACLLTVALPIVQVYTDEVMAETLLMLVSFWGAIYFARYLHSESWKDSAKFGVFASLAILTKGNGWEMAIIPPLAILLTRKYRVLLRPSLWLSVALVCLICVPWQLLTLEMARRGWTGGDKPNIHYTLDAMKQFLVILFYIAGPVLSVLAMIGIALTIVVAYFQKKVMPEWAVLLGLIVSAWLFHVIVPAGVEDRKLVAGVPAIICFLFAGGFWVASKLPVTGGLRPWRPALVALLGTLAFSLQTFAIPHEEHYGYTEAAQYITSSEPLRQAIILVSSERDGEGMLISEIAMHEARPTHYIQRGSKVLSHADWTGESYQSFFHSPSDLMDYLRKAGVGVVVLDDFAPRKILQHHELLLQAKRDYPASWQLLKTFPEKTSSGKGHIQVYRFLP